MRFLPAILFFVTLLGFYACDHTDPEPDPIDPEIETIRDTVIHISVLYTNDEHGWMEAGTKYGGAAGLMYKWKQNEGYDGSDNFLVLSGGDMWAGPAISTWFKGKSMVEVMNAMEYDAAALGNHEFDYTVDVLKKRLEEQQFPLLAANIVEKSTGKVPDFVDPYIIKEIDGVKVGIMGLASLSTPYTTFPTHVKDYEFTDYAEAIEKYVPAMKTEGAAIIMLISHLCSSEMYDLVDVAREYGIFVIAGGHCHQNFMVKTDDLVMMEAISSMVAYCTLEFDFYTVDSTIQNIDCDLVWNNAGGADEGVLDVVNYWAEETNSELSDEIAYTDRAIGRSSDEMQNMVCDSWLHKFDYADVALTNGGGMRQSIPAGPITLSTIVGLMPFENSILELEVTGEQLKKLATSNDICMGGMRVNNGYVLANGDAIDDRAMYTVLTTDYLYSRDDYDFARFDTDPVNTYVHYRQPLIDWLKSIETSITNPLSNYFDYDSRR